MKLYIKAAYDDPVFTSREEAFIRLNELLAENDKHLIVVCAGGFALNYYDIRSSQDIDAFYKSTDLIDDLIEQVGDEFGLNTPDEIWLNSKVSRFKDVPVPKISKSKLIFSYSNLDVYVVDILYLLGMKLGSSRDQDVLDCKNIILKEHYTSLIKVYMGIRKLGILIDKSKLLEAFGDAYGDRWVTAYYYKHGDKFAELPE